MSDTVAHLEAEVLGAVLNDPTQAQMLVERFNPEEFSSWRMPLALVLCEMHAKSLEITPTTVGEYLRVNGHAAKCGHLQVFDAYQAGGFVAYLPTRMVLLRQKYLQRDITTFAARLEALNGNADPSTALDFALAEVERLRKVDGATVSQSAPTMTEFMRRQFSEQEWAIPGVLPAATSLMVTATEGMGKSVLLRQLAVSAAAGMNPFDPADRAQDYQPRRSLIVDCEYSARQVQRQLEAVARYASRHQVIDPEVTDRVAVHSIQRGMDLTDSADVGILRGLIRDHQPDILVIGPLYRCTSKGYMDEDATRQWQQPLEGILSDGVAVVIEHHIGNEGPDGRRSLRPIGSSAMRRWAAQGIGFRQGKCSHDSEDCRSCGRVARVEKWRGSRDETLWPSRIKTPTSGGYWWERDLVAEGLAS